MTNLLQKKIGVSVIIISVIIIGIILLVVYLTGGFKSSDKSPSVMKALSTTNPQPLLMLTDANGNISVFDPMTSNLNSDWKINGKLCISGQCANENDIKTPVGTIFPFAGSTIPQSYLRCDGSAVSRTTYTDLFSVIGTTYGVGDSSTTFNLPDLRGRTVVGVGQGTNLSNRALGQKDGLENVTLSASQVPSHNHTGSGTTSTAGSHQHTAYGWDGAFSGSSGNYFYRIGAGNQNNIPASGDHSHTYGFTTSSSGGDQPHNNMQPFIGLNYIIKST